MCLRAMKTLARLCGSTGPFEHSIVAHTVGTKSLWAGSICYPQLLKKYRNTRITLKIGISRKTAICRLRDMTYISVIRGICCYM